MCTSAKATTLSVQGLSSSSAGHGMGHVKALVLTLWSMFARQVSQPCWLTYKHVVNLAVPNNKTGIGSLDVTITSW